MMHKADVRCAMCAGRTTESTASETTYSQRYVTRILTTFLTPVPLRENLAFFSKVTQQLTPQTTPRTFFKYK